MREGSRARSRARAASWGVGAYAEVNEELEVMEGLDGAALELLPPAEGHHILMNAPEEGAIICVHLLDASIVCDDQIAADVTPRHLRRGSACAHTGRVGLTIPRVDGAVVG